MAVGQDKTDLEWRSKMRHVNAFLMISAFVFLAAFVAMAGRGGTVHVAEIAETAN